MKTDIAIRMNLILLLLKEKNKTVSDEVGVLRGPDFETSVKISPKLTLMYYSKIAVIDSNIYAVGEWDQGYSWFDKDKNCISSFKVYSRKTKRLEKLKYLTYKMKCYKVCSFMQNVYVFGGHKE